jgi:hypothetical protein
MAGFTVIGIESKSSLQIIGILVGLTCRLFPCLVIESESKNITCQFITRVSDTQKPSKIANKKLEINTSIISDFRMKTSDQCLTVTVYSSVVDVYQNEDHNIFMDTTFEHSAFFWYN